MNNTDTVANSLTIIRNALRAKKASVTLPSNKVVEAVVAILEREKYIDSFKSFQDGHKKFLRVHLKYQAAGGSAIRMLRRVSKPGLRRYSGVKALPRVLNGLGLSILSTSKGIMTDAEARRQQVGGEVLCEVW